MLIRAARGAATVSSLHDGRVTRSLGGRLLCTTMRYGAGHRSCQELVELVTDYLEDCLSLPERRRFTAHLDACTDCRVYLAQMCLTIRALGALARP